jgi:hypothetical protein
MVAGPLESLYRALPPGLRAALPARLEIWLRDRALPALKGARAAHRLEARLWAGFSETALPALEALAAQSSSRSATRSAAPREAANACLALARWRGARGEFEEALGSLAAARGHLPGLARDRRHYLLEALFLARLRRVEEARACLAARRVGGGPGMGRFDPSLPWVAATAWNPALSGDPGDTGRALAEINAGFARFGVSPVTRADPGAPLGLDNLRGQAAPRSLTGGPLVSVILPFFNAEAVLGTALESLRAQSWDALDVLMIDDAGTDGGAAIAADFAARDPRFRLIRQPVNSGAYAARNLGLGQARGEYVTTHDADDWSHPEKIARAMTALRKGSAPVTLTDWVRADDALCFWGSWCPSPNQPLLDFSSALFARALVDRVGPWDTARIGADREFLSRIRRLTGARMPEAVSKGCPLAFGRLSEGSLTRAGATHAATARHGIRRDYHEAAAAWHATLSPPALREGHPPFFPAPATIRADRGEAGRPRDLLFIGDFNLLGGTTQSALHMLDAARAAGLSCALFHHRRQDLDPTRPLSPAIRARAAAGETRILAPGERITAKTVVLTYPPLLDTGLDRFPEIAHERLAVVVNQMAERDLARRHPVYDPGRVRANLRRLLGEEGIWLPISARVRALMEGDPRYPVPAPATWTPLIDTASWCARAPLWRGGARAVPVIGRHGRDHALKWPADPKAIRDAYCVDRPAEVRFLGGAAQAIARLGGRPRNWRVLPFGAAPARDFLADLDFFLHYPDPEYIEEFGRAPMEAMAVGVPVILPPEFEPTFGPAALYAAPEAVWPLIAALWRDETAWRARVAAGRAFVAASCDSRLFAGRLATLAALAPEAG